MALRRSRPDALLVIAGEGPARAHLEALAAQLGIAPNVHFIGYLDRERDLADCYAAADVFVFASRTETQGLVLLEALAQGRPVVSTAHLGTASILQPDCGARVSPEKPEPSRRPCSRCSTIQRGRRELSAQARVYAQSWASLDMAWRLAELYASSSRATSPAAHAAQPPSRRACVPAGDIA